jgi:lipid A ethanolaminephosphotransferase
MSARPWRLALNTDALALAGGVYFALFCNGPFIRSAMDGRSWTEMSTWAFAASLVLLLIVLHTMLLGMVTVGRAAKPMLGAFILVAAGASYYSAKYGTYIDPTMVRNVLHTQWAEARELMGPALLGHLLLHALPPLALLSRVDVIERPWRKALLVRLRTLLGAAIILVVVLLLVFQDVAALMRNQRELRYLITPANIVYSTARTLGSEGAAKASPRLAVGEDARRGSIAAQRKKPLMVVLVIGETARAANWGLNGYGRPTTPELAALHPLNFTAVQACGTNTETSLPCMFSAIGRRDFDERRIRTSESLLDVLRRAGYGLQWIDNQSGCKGVCAGIPEVSVGKDKYPDLCDGDHCLDETLVRELRAGTGAAAGDQVLVLHMLGNHGPAYHKRYPASHRRFGPACETGELRKCSREEIVNAYDNALTYTDSVLAEIVRYLETLSATHDTGLVYLSDHGESLGEHGLYLHGVPHSIAPDEQTAIPMVWWLSPGLAESTRLDTRCLALQAAKPWSHDNLFHTMLGLLDVQTRVYEPQLDITAPCRTG